MSRDMTAEVYTILDDAARVKRAHVELGQRARAARLQIGKSIATVAREMSEHGLPWHPTTVVRVEKGQRRLQPLEVPFLALALDASVAELLPRFTEELTPATREIARALLIGLGVRGV